MQDRSQITRGLPVVGNDVVDLKDPRCSAKHRDERFLGRVFAPEERAAIAATADPEHALWLRWAAKEAAYKVVSKVLGAPPPFAHAAFQVEEGSRDGGTVTYGELVVPFRIARREGPLHVIACATGAETWPTPEELTSGTAALPPDTPPHGAPVDDALAARFTPRERSAIHTRPSALVRLHARAELARVLGVDERRLEIVCELGVAGRSPPAVLLDGRGAGADVSLSHHGRWLGWSVLARKR